MINELELYKYIVKAQILEPSDQDYEEVTNLAQGFFVASAAPFENGRPRMLFITAWMAHEGRNLNGDAFVGKELEARVNAGLFDPPFAGMIDLDHDFTARGFWYKTSFAFDEKANKWGIIATGAVWAWRYPELADSVMKQMRDQGYINVSMSAIPEVRETVLNYPGNLGEVTKVLHNPVFFTSAILTVPPGDPDAKGVAVANAIPTDSKADQITEISNEEKHMDEKELEALKTTNAQLQQDMDAIKIKLTEAEVNLKTVSDIKTSLETEFGAVKAELKIYKDREAAESERNKETEAKAKFEARLAKVPAVVKENLDKHPNKELVLAKWREVSDADWDVIEQGFALAYTAPTYLIRSKEEGILPVANDDTNEKNLKNYLRD